VSSPLDSHTIPRSHRPTPNIVLTAHDGTQLSLDRLHGRTVLLTFAYAHCETICPVVVRDVLKAQELLRATGPVPAVLIVTLDPWRDTPSRLAGIARQWRLPAGDAWVLGGNVDTVEKAIDAFHVPRSRNLQNGEITHPAIVYVIDADGTTAFVTTGGAAALATLVRRLLPEPDAGG
jgi:cytochrome oxidase Cu insertion factor (SCO1/SenC/PrrC family)